MDAISVKAPYTHDSWWVARDWDTVTVTGSVKYDGSGQQNHTITNETVPAGWRPYGDNPTAINFGVVVAANAQWCNFVRPNGQIISLGNTDGVYSGVSGGWQCREWRD